MKYYFTLEVTPMSSPKLVIFVMVRYRNHWLNMVKSKRLSIITDDKVREVPAENFRL